MNVIPEVRGLPLVGCAPHMLRDGPGFLLRTARERGPIFRAKMGPGAMLVVAHPDDLRYVLHEQAKHFDRGNSVDLIRPMLGNGLPLSDGELWLRQRRTMQPAFNRGRIAALTEAMARVCERRARELTAGALVNVHAFFTVLTRDVIVETMFSDSLGDDTAAIDEALTVIGAYVARYAFVPVKVSLDWPLPDNVRFRRAIATLDRLVYGLIDARRKSAERKGDLLDALLDARDPETGAPMAERQLRDEVLTIFFAGHETTANLLTWTAVELSAHRDWAVRVRDELASVPEDKRADAEFLSKLPVTNAVLRESLRLHPPAWIFARVAQRDDALRGYEIRKGQHVLLCPLVTHRLEEYWPDPDRFDPERFLSSNPFTMGGAREPHYVPFGAGPHVCIGNHFAITEAIVALMAVAPRGRLSITAPERVRAKVGATLTASHTDAVVSRW
jgi:cytochrome P450